MLVEIQQARESATKYCKMSKKARIQTILNIVQLSHFFQHEKIEHVSELVDDAITRNQVAKCPNGKKNIWMCISTLFIKSVDQFVYT